MSDEYTAKDKALDDASLIIDEQVKKLAELRQALTVAEIELVRCRQALAKIPEGSDIHAFGANAGKVFRYCQVCQHSVFDDTGNDIRHADDCVWVEAKETT